MTVLSVVFQNCQLPKVTATQSVRMDKLWHICAVEYYTRTKRNKTIFSMAVLSPPL